MVKESLGARSHLLFMPSNSYTYRPVVEVIEDEGTDLVTPRVEKPLGKV